MSIKTIQKPSIRIILAISLDGKISLKGGGGAQIGGRGDREVLEESLAWADATLMGANTLRVHQNTCIIHNQNLIMARSKKGLNTQPISIIASNKINHSLNWPYFKQPIERWLITSDKNKELLTNYKGYKRLISQKETWAKTIIELSKRNISNLLILGGAHIVESFLIEDIVDELQLTIVPKIIGGQYSWLPVDTEKMPIQFLNFNEWNIDFIKEIGESQISLRYLRNKKYIYNHDKNNQITTNQ